MIVILPYVQNRVQNDISVIVYHVDSKKSDFWARHVDLLPKVTASAFWTRERHFNQLTEAAKDATTFKAGWDGYDASAPNGKSVARTLAVLSKLKDTKLTPYSVLPSADGGVGISFRGTANKRAVLEQLNNGTSSYMLYGKGYPVEGSEFNSDTDLPNVLMRLEEYL
jgi:hypothetical protein